MTEVKSETMPKVLHVKQAGKEDTETQTFIGRGEKWGNPFIIGRHGNREQVIHKHRVWLLGSSLFDDIHELKGKNLVCFCAPEACHGDTLLTLANGRRLWTEE